MKKVLALLAALALACCTIIQTSPPAPTAPPAEEPAPSPPTWSPEPNYVYELNAADEIIADYDAATWGGTYAAMYNAVSLDVELHHAQYPADLWHVVGGGMS